MGLLIANHLDKSLWSTNQKYWAVVRSNLLHSFLEVHNCVAPFTSHGKLHEFGAEKLISWAKPAHFDFFAINFTVWSHILCTGGDALMASLISSLLHSYPIRYKSKFELYDLQTVISCKSFVLSPTSYNTVWSSSCMYKHQLIYTISWSVIWLLFCHIVPLCFPSTLPDWWIQFKAKSSFSQLPDKATTTTTTTTHHFTWCSSSSLQVIQICRINLGFLGCCTLF
jgi:hypothetical protein